MAKMLSDARGHRNRSVHFEEELADELPDECADFHRKKR